MLYRLRGSLIHTEPSFAVIECAGVGYKCYTTMNTQRSLPAIGKEAVLYTHMNVREECGGPVWLFQPGGIELL